MRTLRVVSVIGGIRPVFGVFDEAVFDGVDPAIMDVVPQILFVSNVMLPKPSLPQPVFAADFVAGAPRGWRHGTGEAGFDDTPSR